MHMLRGEVQMSIEEEGEEKGEEGEEKGEEGEEKGEEDEWSESCSRYGVYISLKDTHAVSANTLRYVHVHGAKLRVSMQLKMMIQLIKGYQTKNCS